MAVVKFKEHAPGQQGEATSFASGDERRVWRVIVNDINDDRYTLMASGFLPAHGSSHPRNNLMVLRTFGFNRRGKFSFEVTAEYSSKPITQKEREKEVEVPWFRAAEIECNPHEQGVDDFRDKDGKAMVNSHGDPFETYPSQTRFPPSVIIRKSLPSIPSWYFSLSNPRPCRNAAPVQVVTQLGPYPTFDAGTLLFVPRGLSNVKLEGPNDIYRYVDVTFELRFDSDQWRWKPADKGPKYWTTEAGPDGQPKTLSYTEGGVASQAYLQNGGQLLPKPWTPDNILCANHPNGFDLFPTADFSVLPLQ